MLAKSAYSVLLIHLNPLVFGFYLAAWQTIYNDYGGRRMVCRAYSRCAAVLSGLRCSRSRAHIPLGSDYVLLAQAG